MQKSLSAMTKLHSPEKWDQRQPQAESTYPLHSSRPSVLQKDDPGGPIHTVFLTKGTALHSVTEAFY